MNQFNEIRWRTKPSRRVQSPSAQQKDWLLNRGSLTKRLVKKSAGGFAVQVISQAVRRPMLNESKRLGLSTATKCIVREVVLTGNKEPWVYARTVMPISTLRSCPHLGSLGNRPLGASLFADRTMRRSEIEVTCIRDAEQVWSGVNSPVIEQARQRLEQAPLWGRRSIYWVRNAPLLVSEIFLHSFFDD